VNAAGERGKERRRLFVFGCVLALCAIGLIVKLIQLMLVIPAQESEKSLVLPDVERGAILDRQGRIFAITTKQKTVSSWIPSLTDAEETADLLSKALDIPKETIKDNLATHPGYTIIKRRASAAEAEAVSALKAQGKLQGIRLEDEYGRSYPEGRLACHAVGYVGMDNVPWDGIEYTLNEDLSPQTVGTEQDTVFGNQVFLTIDVNAQYIVDTIGREAMASTRADSITILVMDARTGEILSYSSMPDFDPNEFQRESPSVDKNALMNRPVAMAYEPGSVFKIFTISSMLDLGAITEESHFTCNGYYEKELSDGTDIKINCVGVHGDVTPQQILKYSCNAGAAYASDSVDSDALYQKLVRYGFGKATGIPLLGETTGLLRKPALWTERSKATIAFGQEVSVSALQIVTAATALTNGGVLLKPFLIRKIVSPDGKTIKEFSREPLWEVVSAATARRVLDMMETATESGGTARRAAVPGLRIAAKTGTAQVFTQATGTYSESDFVASTIGIFPAEDPRLIAYVVIQNPKGESYLGSTIAAPVLRDVIMGLSDYLGIPRQGTSTMAHSGEIEVKLPKSIEIGSVMPDLTGTAKKLLLPLLLRDDITVTIEGSGYVERQSPPPGTKIEKGMKIVLELE
jgi:cell division protein FtsI (penicillin-binding protein 3)